MFSQIKDTKHIRRDLHHVGWVMPQGWDFGALGCPGGGGSKNLYYGHVAYQIDGYDEQNRMKVMFSPEGQIGDIGGEVKRSNIIKFRLPCQF